MPFVLGDPTTGVLVPTRPDQGHYHGRPLAIRPPVTRQRVSRPDLTTGTITGDTTTGSPTTGDDDQPPNTGDPTHDTIWNEHEQEFSFFAPISRYRRSSCGKSDIFVIPALWAFF
jgi:hypothetical protein